MGTQEFNWLDKLIARWRLSKVINRIDSKDNVLDFGCGSQSFFLQEIASKIDMGVGYDFGVKDSSIGNNIKLKNLDKNYQKLRNDKNKYNKIVMLAVLEHIEPERVSTLMAIFKEKLQNGGNIIMTTPTPAGKFVLEFMAYRLKIISENQIKDHKKYYSQKDIYKLAKVLGLKVEKYSTFQLGLNSLIVLGSGDSC
jgi:2-polyprenyl-3-methyl-5-hydroxy-6-metoxy-1,4-benzoquinol methylase